MSAQDSRFTLTAVPAQQPPLDCGMPPPPPPPRPAEPAYKRGPQVPGAGQWSVPVLARLALLLLTSTGPSAMENQTLYQRLGGYDSIAAVTSDLLPRLMGDPLLGRFWQNRGEDGIRREKQLLIDFLCANSGGPLTYVGRDMLTSHKGMGISEGVESFTNLCVSNRFIGVIFD